jgi:signal peptidase I
VKKSLRFLLTLLTAFILMLVVRVVGVTVYSIDGEGLTPLFVAGDRVMVNRWSYGLRVGGGDGGLFSYGRLWRQHVDRGDLVAFEQPQTGGVVICRCKGLPGDTLDVDGEEVVVPSLKDCADADYYWMESINSENPVDSRLLGFVSEENIIGRVFMVAYSHDAAARPWTGWRPDRWFLPI